MFLGDHLLFAGKAFHIVIYGLDALEEVFVHVDLVVGLRDEGKHFLFDCLHLGGGVAFGKIEEDAGNLGEKFAGAVKCRNCVLEGGFFLAGDDGFNFGLLLLDAFLEGWEVMFCLYL